MRFVLDTNEFIAALGVVRHPPSELLFNILAASFPKHTIHIPRTIINEVRNNLAPILFTGFIKIIQEISVIDEDALIPFELGAKYEDRSLKSADALIAAYVEWTGADALVTENRHFLSRQANLAFKILTAESCLRLLNR